MTIGCVASRGGGFVVKGRLVERRCKDRLVIAEVLMDCFLFVFALLCIFVSVVLFRRLSKNFQVRKRKKLLPV